MAYNLVAKELGILIFHAKAVNYRTKKMGYNAAKELYKRVQANLARRD